MKSKQQDLFAGLTGSAKERPEKPTAQVSVAPVAPRAEMRPAETRADAPVTARETAELSPTEPKVPRWRQALRAQAAVLESPRADEGAPTVGPRVYTVGELTGELKGLLESGYPRVLVRGEVTGFRGANASGHLYFALKDDRAQLNAVLFRGQARSLKFALKDGQSVIVEGALNVYEPQGRYSLIASRIEPEGVGAQALAFEQLKQKLLAEGLFGDKRVRARRVLPGLPKRIGVVTSVTGAALRDFLKVVHRRHPEVSVLVADARVQGDGAAADVSRAIRWLSRQPIDVLVVTRGGGSVDDLWAFNEEPVARALFASPVPVVSAIGHEIDVTIADLVADVRAPTPSAAAELVVPVVSDLALALRTTQQRLTRAVERALQQRRLELGEARAAITDPRRLLADHRLALNELSTQLQASQQVFVRERGVALKRLAERVNRQHPGRQLRERRQRLATLGARLQRHFPQQGWREARLRLEGLQHGATVAARQNVQRRREALLALAARLEALSPLKVLTRGYALVGRPDGTLVRHAAEVDSGAALTLRFADGQVEAVARKK